MWLVDSTPPLLQGRGKEGNEAVCGFHAVSSSMLQEGGETTRRVLDSSLVLVVTCPDSPAIPLLLTTGC